MKPLLHSVVALSLLLLVHTHPENTKDAKELPKSKDPVVEAEESQPQARAERCTNCAGTIKLGIKSPKEALAAIQALPGAEVHTQQSFQGCSSDKGCAGLKLKDGKIVERYGNIDSFKTAAAQDTANEFSFQTAEALKALEGGLSGGPFWWMNQDSPFKTGAGGSFGKFSKASSSYTSGAGATGAGAGFGGNAALDLAANPFLNGDFSKLGGFAGDAGVKPGSYQSSSFESSSFSSSNKGDIDISKNPFLNGGVNLAQNGFGAGFGGNQAAFGQGATGAAQTGFGAQSFESQSNFASGSKIGGGYTGSSPTPFATGANVNLIQNSQKTNEFDYQQQQTQQNIDEAFQSTGNVLAQSGGLQQTCAGQGYVCVLKSQCNNGVVNTNGAGVLAANTKKQYCNTATEICCRIEISPVGVGSVQGSLGVGSATFQGGTQGSGLFGSGQSSQSAFGAQGQSTFKGQTNFGSGQSAFGAQGFGAQSGTTNIGAGVTRQPGFGLTGTVGQAGFGSTFNANRAQTASSSFGAGTTSFNANRGITAAANSFNANRGVTAGANSFNANRGVTAAGTNSFNANRGVTAAGTNSYNANRGVTAAANSFNANRGVSSSSYSNKFGSTFGANSFGSTLAPTTPTRFSPAQSNFIETDSFSAGSETAGVYRPGSSGTGLKPGIPYLPPVDNTNSPSNVYPSSVFPTTFTTPKPTYLPPVPSTSAPGYLPPVGEQTINRETRLPPNPNYVDGQLILDENRQPRPKPTPGPVIADIPAGCAAALKCTPIEYCTAEGVISTTVVALTRDQEAYRVPLTDCKDISSGRIGKCCRDPLYTDPWPTNQLGQWVPGVFGGNDGQYVPDSRGSPNNPRPAVTARPPVTGTIRLDNFRPATPKPTVPYGPSQVTPGYPATTLTQTAFGQGSYSQTGQGSYSKGGQGSFSQGGQGSYSQGGRGQIGVGQVGIGQGQVGGNQLASGSNFNTAFSQQEQYESNSQVQGGSGVGIIQGQGTGVSQGFGTGIRQGVGQGVTSGQGVAVSQGFGTQQKVTGFRQGQGSVVSQGGGALVSQGAGQFSQGGGGALVSQGGGQYSQGGGGALVSQGGGALVSQGGGQYSQGGGGALVSQGGGQYSQGGGGALVSQGGGQYSQGGGGALVSQGGGALVSQGGGQYSQGGGGALVSQGGGQYSQGGGGALVSQGGGQYSQGGGGALVSQGGGALVSQGGGQYSQGGGGALVSQGGGQYSQGGGGAIIRGQAGQFGQGFGVSQGTGQGVFQGQGSLISQGFGAGIKQGQGVAISQGSGFGVENEFSESVQRVFLSRYDGSGQCGLLNPTKPYGNRNDNEVDFAEIPWQAMVLLQTSRSLLCGGVITRPDVVVTSAACVDGLEAKNVLIKGGEWKLGIDEEPLPFQIVQVKTILRHPFYKRGSLLYDAAILVLAEDLRWANNIQPICLPRAEDTLDAFYNGAGECIVTGWGKQVLQAHLLGSIMHSINVSLINPGECQAKLTQDYPHLLEQYDEGSCACGQPTNPLNNICRVDIGSALACTTGDGHYVMRGVYSWDSGCQTGNQIAAFYKFDLEWYEWAIGLIETTRFTITTTTTTGNKVVSNTYSGQYNGGFKQGVKGGVKGGSGGSSVSGSSYTSSSYSQESTSGGSGKASSGLTTGTVSGSGFNVKGSGFETGAINGGIKGFGSQGAFGFGQGQFSGKFNDQGFGGVSFDNQIKAPVSNSFSASYTEKKVYQTEPKFVSYTTKPEIVTFTTKPKYYTYTTKPEIVTFTTKPEIFTYTTKPEIFTYTTKPKLVTYTTKPQFISYETSGSRTNPQYVAPGVTFNPSFSDVVGQHTHNANCKCLPNKKK